PTPVGDGCLRRSNNGPGAKAGPEPAAPASQTQGLGPTAAELSVFRIRPVVLRFPAVPAILYRRQATSLPAIQSRQPVVLTAARRTCALSHLRLFVVPNGRETGYDGIAERRPFAGLEAARFGARLCGSGLSGSTCRELGVHREGRGPKRRELQISDCSQ